MTQDAAWRLERAEGLVILQRGRAVPRGNACGPIRVAPSTTGRHAREMTLRA